MAAKREKTKYPGVYYRLQERLDGYGEEKAYYVMYRRGGRGAKLIEEPVGRESEGMTAAKANRIRASRIAGKEQSNTERRAAEEAARLADESRWTIAKLWGLYQECHPPKNAKSHSADVSRFERYLRVPFGNKTVDEITTADIDVLRSKMSQAGKSPATIHRVLDLLRLLMNFAVTRGICLPYTARFEMPKLDNQKTEMLSDEQLERLLQALDEEPDQNAAALMRIALLTGLRPSSLFGLQWKDCDFERGFFLLQGEHQKNGTTSAIPMSEAAKTVLLSIERTKSPYVFPGKDGGKRKVFRRIANRVKKKAGLPEDYRPLYCLRHNFASRLASSGKVDMYALQKCMGHKDAKMTQRYAHLHDEALRRAATVADEVLLPTNLSPDGTSKN